MSMVDTVVEAVREMGAATNAQVCERLRGVLTAKQIGNGLREATARERLVTTRRHVPGTQVIEATYRIKPAPRVLRYPSVWHYGQGDTV